MTSEVRLTMPAQSPSAALLGGAETRQSKWNYVVPAIGLAAWTGSVIALITWGGQAAHDYEYPNNQINPQMIEMTKDAAKGLAMAGAATLPLAVATTLVKAVYAGTSTLCNGVCNVGSAFVKVVKDSFNPSKFGEPEAIAVNTAAAVVGGLVLACYGLAASARNY